MDFEIKTPIIYLKVDLTILVRLEVPFTNMTNIVGKNREV